MVDAGSGRLARVGEVDLPGLDRERLARAQALHGEIRRAVESHRRSSAYRERGYHVFPVVGVAQVTPQSARLDGGRLDLLASYEGEDLSGDGTVPRVSATPLERGQERREMYAGTCHASLQSAGATLTHVVGMLGGFAVDLDAYRRPRADLARVALEAGDVHGSDEPIRIRARVDRDGVRLSARVRPAVGGALVARVRLERAADGEHSVRIPPLAPGSYRVSVTGGDVEPAEDVFVVCRRRG